MMFFPHTFHIPLNRRRFLKSLAVVSAGFTLPGYLAEALILTPQQTQGPFYPLANNIPLDKDNDLVHLNDTLTVATGIVTYVSGRVLDSSGSPIRNALVELWHADHGGNYTYSTSATRNPAADPNFGGFGQFVTGASGAFGFRTVRAGLYPGRARHFHWGVTIPGRLTRFTTQTYWNNEPGNASDGPLNGISDPDQRASIILDYGPVSGTATGEVQTNWDFVSGFTPVEPVYPGGGNLVVPGTLVAGPTGGIPRYQLTFPAYTGYTYEVYGNPTLADLEWKALPFAMNPTSAIDRNKQTATSNGSLHLYVEAAAGAGFYKVTYRVPGANTGSP